MGRGVRWVSLSSICAQSMGVELGGDVGERLGGLDG